MVGCDDVEGATMELVGIPIHDTIVREGALRIDTCGQTDDATFISGCTREDVSGPDLIVRLDVPVGATYRMQLTREGSPTDPVLYVRSACDEAASELACDDDSAGSRGSSFDVTLAAGDYFLILDTFQDVDEAFGARCGAMNLTVSILP